MPTLNWLKTEFNYGYSSGDVLSLFPDKQRRMEQKRVGGSYRQLFRKAVTPRLRPDSVVLELGPGRGSWTRALLKHVPHGAVHTVDYQDTARWLEPEKYNGRLQCHVLADNEGYSRFADGMFDFCFSFGVLCHNNIENIERILTNILPKMKPGACAVHEYGDWQKLEAFGWEKGGVPVEFREKPDDEIWWPRNNQASMTAAATRAGWTVLSPDLGLVQRDSIILLERPH